MEDVSTPRKKLIKTIVKTYSDDYIGLDLSFQGIKNLSKALFRLVFLKELNLKGNELEIIPSEIHLLKDLEILNLSKNKIKYLPASIGKMVNLKELYLSDNLISNVPMEIGSLYNLNIFEIGNNPLVSPFNTLYKEKKLLHYCKEHNTNYPQPLDRTWIDTIVKKQSTEHNYTFGTYNILSNFYAMKLGYVPSWILNSEYRKENILHDIQSYNVDILALQEIETYSYNDFYRDQLEMRCDYDSIFCPNSRAKSMSDNKTVHGCAIFWKKTKFRLINNYVVDFYSKIIQDNRFCKNQDVLNRYGKKDNIALIAMLETMNNELIMTVNVHVYWDPEYKDVKLIQVILLLEEIEKIKSVYKNANIVLLGDFNSLRDSSVYSYITKNSFDKDEFLNVFDNFSLKASHNLKLTDSYINEDIDFTNFTPTFKGVIDYIFHSENLQLTALLSPVESEYVDRVVGLPNIHFPSDHIFISAKFKIKKKNT